MRAARITLLGAALLLAGLAVTPLAGCAGGASNSTEGGSDDEDGDAGPPKAHKEMERPVSDQGKSWGGWRWKGKSEDCFYVVRNQCYASLAAACKVARCKKSECVHDDSAPAKVSCDR